MKKLVVLLSVISALSFMGCQSEGDDLQVSDDGVYVQPALTEADGKIDLNKTESEYAAIQTDFAAKLFDVVYSKTEGDNVLISPVSASMALSLALNGANGESYDQLLEALGFSNADLEKVNDLNYKLIKGLPALDDKTILSFANAIFSKDDLDISSQFLSRLNDAYSAVKFNFENNSESTAALINNWCSNQTYGKIPVITSAKEMDNMVLALINTVYLSAPWTFPFDVEMNTMGSFINSDGTTADRIFMNSRHLYSYSHSGDFSLLSVDLGGDRSYSPLEMTFVLPDEGRSLDQAIGQLAQQMHGIESASTDVLLSMPKFEENVSLELTDAMKDLGATDIFDSSKADFSKMTDSGVYINNFTHKVYLSVDEKGITGAAASALKFELMESGDVVEPIKFTLDRPFAYFVKEKSTGTILFIGAIRNLE